jgi:predicted ATPase
MIYSFDHCPVKAVRYEETEHFQVYKDFMENPGKYALQNLATGLTGGRKE